jgi:hypothetical protein
VACDGIGFTCRTSVIWSAVVVKISYRKIKRSNAALEINEKDINEAKLKE